MKKYVVSALFLTLCVNSYAGELVAMVKKLDGDVSIKRMDNNIKSSLGQKLYEKDIVTTGKNGTVSIVFNDGSILNLTENSIIAIDNFVFKPATKDFNFALNMKKGKGIFESGKIGKISPESFKLKFPDGVVGIRGTKFLLEVK